MTIEAIASLSTLVPDPLVGPAGRYVVGFDGSPSSRAALVWTVNRAARGAVPVHIVGVVDDDSGAMGAEFSGEAAHMLGHLLSQTAEEVSAAHPEIDVTTGLTSGAVPVALAAMAGADDLLVVGSDKTGYARGRLYGSRGIQLAARAACSIAVVPSVDLRLRSGVVVAMDSTDRAMELARIGALEAGRRRSSLVLVHAVPTTSDTRRSVCADALLTDARALVRRVDEHLDVWSHVARRHTADAILNFSRDKALLVLGRSRHPEGFGIGGTLHEVLLNANVPIVILAGDQH